MERQRGELDDPGCRLTLSALGGRATHESRTTGSTMGRKHQNQSRETMKPGGDRRHKRHNSTTFVNTAGTIHVTHVINLTSTSTFTSGEMGLRSSTPPLMKFWPKLDD